MKIRRPLRPLLVRVAIIALVAFLLAIPAGYGFLQYTTRPQFCTSCHIMEPYVKSWEESAHAFVPCVDCHYEPGVLETAKGKFKALNQVAKYVTGTEGTKPWAEVSDSSCMRSGCHSTRLLAGEVSYDVGMAKIPFDHSPHLLEMRRSKKLRCTSCHSQIVQGEHVSVTPSTCFLCHFKGAAEDPKLSKCNTCHGAPERPIEIGGFVFDHKDYLARGVDCLSCHASITRGTGEVPKQRCNSCHSAIEHIERYGETEFLHRNHVTDHKVDCLECHTEIVHKLPTRESSTRNECSTCHDASHGVPQAFYRGEGGRGAPPQPSAMYLARVGCNGCHLHLPGVSGGAQGDAQDGAHGAGMRGTPAREVACLSCHGPAYDGMMGRWQKAFGEATEAIELEVAAALASAEKAPGVEKALLDAKHDVALVRGDGSRGVHNPWYARNLLQSAHDRAQEALAKAEPGRSAQPFPLGPSFATSLGCATLCHLGIEEQTIGLEGTRFNHGKHLGRAGDCDACHTTKEHGKTLVTANDCASCHHGEKAPKGRTCASCHQETDALLRGAMPDGEQGVQMMMKVACEDCHGDATRKPVLDVVRENCVRCHKDRYPDMVDEWVADSTEWFAEATARLAKIRAPAQAKGGAALEAFARAEEIVARLRRAGPAHNVLRFEEEKEAFDESAEEAEKALR